MAIEIELVSPENYSNPVSVESAFLENNQKIKEAFAETFSRINTSGDNFLRTDLDMNHYRIINVGDSPFVTRSEIGIALAGELRKSDNGDLEYRPPGASVFSVLFTNAELSSGDITTLMW